MHFTGLLLLASGAAAGYVGESPFDLPRKRATASCTETYGPGSVPCGDTDSGFCYNPSAGQICCSETDFGFCQKGSFCAPVAGFCCMEGESVQDCAQAAGFKLPSTLTATLTATISLGAAADEPQTTPSPIIITLGTTSPAFATPINTVDLTSTALIFPNATGSSPFAVVTAAAAPVERRLLLAGAVAGAAAALAAW